jgi:hypothetical protein
MPSSLIVHRRLTCIACLLLIPLALPVSSARAQKSVAELPKNLQYLMPPPSDYTLDAGASQVLPLGKDGSVKADISVTATPRSGAKATALRYRWSVAKAPQGATVTFDAPNAAHTGAIFQKPGAYFLRVDVSALEGWTDWQSVVVQIFSPTETGFAMDRFPAPPKPGIHPRIFINPDEVPALRERLKNTAVGREVAKKLEINSRLLRDGMAGFNPKGPLGTLMDGTPSIGNAGYFASSSGPYRKLVAGDMNALGESIRGMDGNIARLGKQMTLEALWCLITEDKQGAENLAAAITTWAKIVAPTIKPEDDWQWDGNTFGLVTYGKQEMGRVFDKVGRDNLGLCYDFIYNYMKPEQRDAVRTMISKATTGKVGFGTDQPHYARVGNWITFHTSAIMLLSLAIEGEAGYDPAIYQKGAEMFRDFYQYSVLEDGESFESLGKGGAWPFIVPAMAKRGDWVAAHPHLRDYYRRYLLNCLQPYRNHYVALSTLGDAELSGGMQIDACIAKYCFPNDPQVEEVYRNLLGENYGGDFKVDNLLSLALWGQDYKTAAGQPWEWDKSQPLTYVGRDQGLVVTRSDWTNDALYLYFDCGSNIRDMGHYDPARNLFILSAMGRNWIGDTGKEEMAEAHNVVLIDGKGGSKCPGRLVSVADSPDATSLCGDAKYAYDWQWDRGSHTHGEVDPTTVNQIRFEPLPERWMGTPLTYLYSFFAPFRLARTPYNPVQCAFRTALLRRGAHPYVVIGDTIQKDGKPHNYEFLLRIPIDLENQVKVNGNDIVLSDPKTDRRMLVRVVAPGTIEVKQRLLQLRTDMKKERRILSIATNAVRPDFRVIFFPYHEGAALPKTTWTDLSGELRLQFGNQGETCRFDTNDKGEPRVQLIGK